jgi:hypothetical protein
MKSTEEGRSQRPEREKELEKTKDEARGGEQARSDDMGQEMGQKTLTSSSVGDVPNQMNCFAGVA